ncbi:MAG TPA: DUF3604 domain-containing protein [Chitinophagales bacterium]|nr:DUF3604 domain-containing protein [Chitinophagales bacterium]
MKSRILHFFLFLLIPFFVSAQENPDEYFSAYVTPDHAIAGTKTSVSIIIKAEKEIKANTLFKVKFVKGFDNMQQLLPNFPGYVKASTSADGGRIAINSVLTSYDENISFWELNVHEKIITIVTRNADMAVGDSITITVGEGNGPNSLLQVPNTANKENLEIAMSDNGNVNNLKLTTHTPPFEIKANTLKTVYLFASSVAKAGQEAKLLVTTADDYFNIVQSFTGEINLSVNNSQNVILPQKVILTPSDSGKKEIPIFFVEEGSYVISGSVNSGNVAVVSSNPVRVDNERPFIYWGDLHSHGAPSRDGVGRGRYEYARYARALDFMCATDHADHGKTIYGLSDREWTRQKAEVLANHVPGKFIPFIGYENSYLYPTGHYNLIFNVKDEEIDNVPMWPMRVVNDIQTVWSLAQNSKIDLLTIPHHCGKVFNVKVEGDKCKNCNSFGGIQYNEEYKKLIEIYSYHGLSESYDPNHNLSYYGRSKIAGSFNGPNYAQDAWAMGEKLGVIASSDDHTGHPGSIVNGVVAVYANELERDTLFQAMKNRHTYGTTGERIWVDFRVNNALMGSTITIHPDTKPTVSFDVMGTDSIDYAEVLKWDFKRGVFENGHPKFEIIAKYNTNSSDPKNLKVEFIDPGFTDSCMYYLRVKQTNVIIDFIDAKEVWAWTSPVWMSHKIVNVDQTDSLKSYMPVGDEKKVRHFWSMYNIDGVSKYQIEKKSDQGVWQVLFDYTPNDPYQLDFQYVELYPKNGQNIYRLRYTNAKGVNKYSAEAIVELKLDSLISFSSTIEDGSIALNWSIDKELYTSTYTVEVEENGVFKNIGLIDANIKLEELISEYSFNTNISQSGIYTFRLSQKIDNKIVDTKLITVEIVPTRINDADFSNDFTLKSNLLNSSASTLEFKIAKRLSGSNITIVDILGRTIIEVGKVTDVESWKKVSLQNIPSATYRVVIKTTGGDLYSVPFVIVQ